MDIEKTILMRKYLKRRLSARSIVILAVTFIALSTLTYTADVRHTNGDSALSLLVSRAIIEDGSIKLNKYEHLEHTAMVDIKGSLYDYFPLGTPLLSIPAVFVMDSLGIHKNAADAAAGGQVVIMTLFNPLIFILLFFLCRQFVPDTDAFLISLVSFLGSLLTSALSTALWSHTYALIISLVVILQLSKYDMDDSRKPNSYIIGVLVFLACLTRPAFLGFGIATLLYLLIMDRKLFVRTAAASLCMLAAFLLFSYNEYGQAFPPYYLQETGTGEFLTGLYGLLLSPSRGMFVFMPYLLVTAAGAVFFARGLKKERLFIYALVIVAVNIVTVSMSPQWSGGRGFGPRLLVDSIPAWVLLTSLIWMHMRENSSGKFRRVAGWTWLILGTFAVWINAYQGLYNEWTDEWNNYPPLELNASKIAFDWKHPQIFSTAESVRDKLLWYYDYKDHDVAIDPKGNALIHFDLTRAEGYIERGKYHLARGLSDKAFEDFDTAISISHLEPEAYYYMGDLHLQKGRNEEAIEDFTTSLVYNPDNVHAYIGRGTAYDNTGQYDLALNDYVKASSLSSPSDSALMGQLLLRRGIDHLRVGYYTEAVKDLREALEHEKESPDVLHHIAAANYAARNFRNAADSYREVLGVAPNDEKARLLLLNSLRKDPDFDSGAILNDHKDFVVATPSQAPVRLVSRHYLGMEALTEEEIIKATEKNGTPAELCETYYLLAEQRLLHGYTIGARKLLKKGEKACPKDIPDYYLTRSLLNWLGR